jgi:hypothetical protein
MKGKDLKFEVIAIGTTLALSIFSINVESVRAASIPGLFNTGVDGTGNVLPLGSIDPHYNVVEVSDPAVIMTIIPDSYVDNSSTSSWIWENANGQPINVTRTFRTTFDLTGLIPSTASISGFWATDNIGLDILINGISTSLTNPGFASFTPFTISSGFTNGVNVLDFVVNDFGAISGFRVDGIAGTADPTQSIPTPALLPGLLGMGTAIIRKRRQEVVEKSEIVGV